jgi:hypothetical protein
MAPELVGLVALAALAVLVLVVLVVLVVQAALAGSREHLVRPAHQEAVFPGLAVPAGPAVLVSQALL